MVAGDINAEVVGVRTGAAALLRAVERYGLETLRESSVERMYDHGEAVVRSYFEQIPDGRYVGHGEMDDERPRRRAGAVRGRRRGRRLGRHASTIATCPTRSGGPDQLPAPLDRVGEPRSRSRCSRAAASRRTRATSAPIEVVTRPGSMFHPDAPGAVLPYGWPAIQAIEAIYNALAKALPTAVPACSGGDICVARLVGRARGDGRAVGRRLAAPGRPGRARLAATARTACMHIAEAATRFSPTEVWEAKNPWLLEQVELRAGLGRAGPAPRRPRASTWTSTMLEDQYADRRDRAHQERAVGPRGRRRGARRTASSLELPDGTRAAVRQGDAAARAEGRDARAAHRRRRRLRRPGGARARGRAARRARGLHQRGVRAAALPARVPRTAHEAYPPHRPGRRRGDGARLRDPRHGWRRRDLHGLARHARGAAHVRAGRRGRALRARSRGAAAAARHDRRPDGRGRETAERRRGRCACAGTSRRSRAARPWP